MSVAPSGQAQIFEGGEWKPFDSWELMSEGTPLSFFLFNLRWQDLIAEDEYLHSYRGPHEKQSSIEVEFKRVLTAANSTIMWMLADYDGAERLEVYRLFEARLETHATHLQ